MSGYKNFAIIGASGSIGSFITRQFLKEKAEGAVDEVVVLTREGSDTTAEDGVKVIKVDYSNHESVKNALDGIDVVISALRSAVLHLQPGIAAAAKQAGVKLFVPSEFGGVTEGATEGVLAVQANVHAQLRAIGIPYTLFYTGMWPDFIFNEFTQLDLASGKVTIGGDGNSLVSFTSRTDVARYVAYALTRLPIERLQNRAFSIAGDSTSFSEIFKQYEAKTARKLEITHIPVSELNEKLAENPQDIVSFLRKFWAVYGPLERLDNNLYPGWNPSSVANNLNL
ncbi:NAD-P-binding protein [Gloeopeniophorella convolvens]|nr:NAD-P-binding protein [Gloeopeniophorella convolvens]